MLRTSLAQGDLWRGHCRHQGWKGGGLEWEGNGGIWDGSGVGRGGEVKRGARCPQSPGQVMPPSLYSKFLLRALCARPPEFCPADHWTGSLTAMDCARRGRGARTTTALNHGGAEPKAKGPAGE